MMSACRKPLLIIAAGVGVLIAGCATTIDTAALEHARAAVGIATQNPRIPRDRSADLQEAERQIALADRAVANGAYPETVSHHAYLAEVRAQIALATANAQAANAEIERLNTAFTKESTLELDRARGEVSQAQHGAGEAARRARALSAEKTDRGLVLTLSGVLFQLGSAELESAAKVSVARIAGFLIALPGRAAVVEGHTDNAGTAKFNRDLSMRRANGVRDFMVANGVLPERIVTDGYGAAYPVAFNDSSAGRDKNRRVEIIILEAGEAAETGRRKAGR